LGMNVEIDVVFVCNNNMMKRPIYIYYRFTCNDNPLIILRIIYKLQN